MSGVRLPFRWRSATAKPGASARHIVPTEEWANLAPVVTLCGRFTDYAYPDSPETPSCKNCLSVARTLEHLTPPAPISDDELLAPYINRQETP
ncbi:hypothetical protein D3C72_844670 [compost metagenome]